MWPRSSPESVLRLRNVSSNQKTPTQLWHVNGECPENTIPIRRTSKEDLYRSIENQKSLPVSAAPPYMNHEYATMTVKGGVYCGAKADLNVWNPLVETPKEFSLAQIWVVSGSYSKSDINAIEAGWHVYPKLYDYSRTTRFFVYWTMNAYQGTGCYNLRCEGFVQRSKKIALGASLSPSNYGDTQQYIPLLIWKDPIGQHPDSGNWWLKYGDEVIGYWPAKLFTHLQYHCASTISWGGEVINLKSQDGQHTTTQMGSGHFAELGWQKASHFKNIEVVDGSNKFRKPENPKAFADHKMCYSIESGSNDAWGSYFYFGGPGRNEPECP